MEKAAPENLKPHVVESDVAILEGRGKWVSSKCAKGCSLECAPRQYVVDEIPVRAKNLDYFEETDLNCNYQTRGCHGARVSRRWVFGPARNKYPMKRKHWQPGGGDNVNGELRGKDEWERISWDDALDMCASEIKRIYETYGPTSTISYMSMGTGIQNVLGLMGGYVEINDTVSCGTWEADHGWWGLPNYGHSATDPQDWVNADYYILSGYDILFTQNTASTCYLAAKEAGVKFLYVGPCLNQTAQVLEARWIPVRPGTDTAYWTGVAYEMLKLDEERGDVIDWDFLKKYTLGFTMDNMPDDAKLDECYQGYLLGEYDGVPKTAAWASKICGASEQDIKDMAEILGKNNDVILTSSSAPARNTGTENFAHVFFTVGLMGAHMGKPGNAVQQLLFGNNFKAMGYTGEQGRSMGSVKNPLYFETEEHFNLAGHPSTNRNLIAAPLHWRDMLAGKYTSWGSHNQQEYPPVYNSGVEHDIDVKFIWNGSRNFLSMSIDVFNAIKVYRNCEFVLTQQPYASTVARFSDIVLPVTTAWEGSLDQAENAWPTGTDNRYGGAEVVHCKYPVCEPMWEARSDNRIAREIGERLGFDPDQIRRRKRAAVLLQRHGRWPVHHRGRRDPQPADHHPGDHRPPRRGAGAAGGRHGLRGVHPDGRLALHAQEGRQVLAGAQLGRLYRRPRRAPASLRERPVGDLQPEQGGQLQHAQLRGPERAHEALPELLRAHHGLREDVQGLGQADQGRLPLPAVHVPRLLAAAFQRLLAPGDGVLPAPALHQSRGREGEGAGHGRYRARLEPRRRLHPATVHGHGGHHARLPGPGRGRYAGPGRERPRPLD